MFISYTDKNVKLFSMFGFVFQNSVMENNLKKSLEIHIRFR